jgi:hypothetical protein
MKAIAQKGIIMNFPMRPVLQDVIAEPTDSPDPADSR